MSNKKPDSYVENAALLPYGSNIGAPAIKISNIEHWKEPRVLSINQQFENKFEELSREVVNLEMSNVQELGQKTFMDPSDKSYTVWIALEANKKCIFDKIDAKISSDAKLKVDYDKQKFQSVFDSEMKKLADEGK
jgi:hypothetical protein